MRFLRFAILLSGVAVALLTSGGAKAGYLTGSFNVSVVEGLTHGSSFNTLSTNPFNFSEDQTGATATFTYTGSLNFSALVAPDQNSAFGYTASNVTNYQGSGTVKYNGATVANYATEQSFLNSSQSSGNYAYGTWFKIDLGTLSAGTVLTLTHDDGASVWQNGAQVGTTVSGPTPAVTDTVTLLSTADTILYYSAQNGAPSILQVSTTDVPEPSSLVVMLAGLGGLAYLRRRSLRAA